MTGARRGRKPKKQARNLTGLRNQPRPEPVDSDSDEAISGPDSDDSADPNVYFDSARVDWEKEENAGGESDLDVDEEDLDVEDLDDEDFGRRLAEMASKEDDKDTDWIPYELRPHAKAPVSRKGRALSYGKGPDVMNKSQATAYRHRSAWKGQGKLDGFGFHNSKAAMSALDSRSQVPMKASRKAPACPSHTAAPLSSTGTSSSASSPPTIIIDPDSNEEDIAEAFAESVIPQIRRVSASPEASDDEDHGARVESETEPTADALNVPVEESIADAEAWEEELDEDVRDPKAEIKDWTELRKQIKEDLKWNSKTLPLSKINQLLILSNFATLRIKGLSRIQASLEIARQWHEGEGNWFARRVRTMARHYQIFEQLPIETRGGSRMSRSFLCDENVKKAVLQYLNNIPAGKVTPYALQKQVNGSIFPELAIKPKSPLSLRTARHWLIKLGWTHTLIKKGVYMDGHERADVVLYHNDVFLPMMAEFEKRMVHYEGPELTRVEPKLADGKKELIPLFHDECCFHANDQTSHAWLDIVPLSVNLSL
ncbi:hypothetical protein C8J56DRAFT_903250 [Mycena floridula]|nr:hypothetical protein C8J56DRAFT_903250 [Mycena floridula]